MLTSGVHLLGSSSPACSHALVLDGKPSAALAVHLVQRALPPSCAAFLLAHARARRRLGVHRRLNKGHASVTCIYVMMTCLLCPIVIPFAARKSAQPSSYHVNFILGSCAIHEYMTLPFTAIFNRT